MASLHTDKKLGNMGDWQGRHNHAISEAGGFPIKRAGAKSFEIPIVKMLTAWAEYALAHKQEYESPIGEDYVLGEQWEEIGRGIRGLLDGSTGRLDCGTLDAFILNTLAENGIGEDEL